MLKYRSKCFNFLEMDEFRMYIFEKLCRLYEEDPFSLDGIIAKSLVEHFEALPRFSEIGFCKETGISKAGLHRFFSKAGFKSFKELCSSLMEDRQRNVSKFPDPLKDLDLSTHKQLADQIKASNCIVLYGDLFHIPFLSGFISTLKNASKLVYVLEYWDLETSYRLLKSLDSNTVFILFDFNTSTENFFEFSLIRNYMLDMNEIAKLPVSKFHLTNVQKEPFKEFIPVPVPYHNGSDLKKLFDVDFYLHKLITK